MNFKSISRTPAKFDTVELEHLNKRCLHELSYTNAQNRLQQIKADKGEVFWEIVRQNLDIFNDVAIWSKVIEGDFKSENTATDVEFLAKSAQLLPQEPWDETTWGTGQKSSKVKRVEKGVSCLCHFELL